MNANHEVAQPRASRGPARRIAATVMLCVLIFVALVVMSFSVLTSALIASGCCVVLVAASSVSDAAEMVLDAIAMVVFGIFAAIAALFAAIFGLFGW